MKSASLSIFSAQSLQLLLLFHLFFCSAFPFENRKSGRPEPLAGIFSNKAQLHLWYHCFLGEGRGWKGLLIHLHSFCLWHPPDQLPNTAFLPIPVLHWLPHVILFLRFLVHFYPLSCSFSIIFYPRHILILFILY